MQLRNKSRHLKTPYHEDILRRQEHPEKFENEETPDAIHNSKNFLYFGCHKCGEAVLSSQWQTHTTTEKKINNLKKIDNKPKP